MDVPTYNDIINRDHAYHFTNKDHGIISHDHDYVLMDLVHNDNDFTEPIENYNSEPQELTREVLNLEKPKTYKIVFGTQRTTEIIQDNLGFLYYKNKKTENKIYLVCLEKKSENSCRATAHISPDPNDDKFILCKQHNHKVRPFNEEVPLLRQTLTEKALKKSVCSYSTRGIYMEEIVNFPNAAQDYTFIQGSRRMRRLRQKSLKINFCS